MFRNWLQEELGVMLTLFPAASQTHTASSPVFCIYLQLVRLRCASSLGVGGWGGQNK